LINGIWVVVFPAAPKNGTIPIRELPFWSSTRIEMNES